MTKLSMLPLGSVCKIYNIASDAQNKNRLLELGFIEGTKVEIIKKSPAGDPTAYGVRGTVIALRSEDAENILVIPVSSEVDLKNEVIENGVYKSICRS